MHWQSAIITRVEKLSPRVKSFFFRLPEPVFVSARSARFAGAEHTKRLSRPTQLLDRFRARATDKAEELELTIERLDDGECSPFMHDVARVDDEIELGGPIGGPLDWIIYDGGPVLFIGGGSGVVPFMSMLRCRGGIGSRVPVDARVFRAIARQTFYSSTNCRSWPASDRRLPT